MSKIFDKLNYKGQREIVVVNAPDAFEKELDALDGVCVMRSLSVARDLAFALLFVTRQNELNRLSTALAAKVSGDAVVWFAYPKGTSKRYTCDFNRDRGWDVLKEAGFDSVRMVAIDEDWSALRFRRVEYIKERRS
jgi:hypothetical protein